MRSAGATREPGIVLRPIKLGDSSKIVSVLTPRWGRVKLVAKGSRQLDSRLSALLESGNELDLTLYPHDDRELWMLGDASLVRAALTGGNTLNKLSYLLATMELTDRLLPEREPVPEFELLLRGQTPGKKVLGIAVVNDDLSPVTLGTSLLRNLLRTVDFLPLFYLGGVVTMLSNRRFQRLGDLAAGTLVISSTSSRAAQVASVAVVEPLAPAIQLSRSEQSTLVEFLQRSSQISQPRQQELASILEGITHDEGEDGVDRLRRYGAWYLGLR